MVFNSPCLRDKKELIHHEESQLQLADDGGIDDLPIADIYSGMDNLGSQFEGQPMPLLAAMLSQAQAGEGVGTTNSDPIAPVFEHGQSSDPNKCFFSLTMRLTDEPFTSTNFGIEPFGSFYSCSRSQEKSKQWSKTQPKKRKVVVSDSDQDEGGEQTVDLDALIALANAAVTVDSNIPPGGPSNDPAASSHIPSGVPTDGDFAPAHSTSPSRDPFKGKGVAEPSSPVSKRTKKQLADERLSEIEAARLEALERERFEKEKAEIARHDEIYAKQLEQEEEMSASQRETRQEEVLFIAKHYSDRRLD
ncbi:hypothetical protein Tco_1181408 [Tanacetum coccineum]